MYTLCTVMQASLVPSPKNLFPRGGLIYGLVGRIYPLTGVHEYASAVSFILRYPCVDDRVVTNL